ncbi:precorrin-6y C5,15-methyltransferase (decarboxylating) subunit CbiE [Stakelama pacifica]|uniref:Precorrin-6Y C5,15-methyltransferase (Decarboxylating) n=1 Tax=Stakelama pacifica TaxID=517720 RepID=A0A4R6FAM2_9SPHN|nr:precorrin-6y C5,15-methyltransferase (decarboxylating) subunit CbiE [Stakelama pacifica]TDN78092.1 precorrin-6Y C5,15-methyltransferase (decarboxylating) [Stakelama pacifica]GGP00373.1 precorrin-6Y methyltransferase [Stakelama pacifica]
MANRNPWLTIIGIGEDGPAGLSTASRDALDHADHIVGAPRHIALLPPLACSVERWPVPFDAGIEALLARRGTPVVMLASGDPFWFGAGGTIARHLSPDEWVGHPVPGSFSLAAARLGWRLEDTECLGLHAAPLTRLRPILAPGARAIILVRDGDAARDAARYVTDQGFGESRISVLEALGGPRERIRSCAASAFTFDDITHPVALAIHVAGEGAVLPHASGIDDQWFAHDGQMTRRPARALTLSALAPRPGETLWDIGAGSGSVAIEWLLAHRSTRAIAFERDPDRAACAKANAAALGMDRLSVVEGKAPAILTDQPLPQAVFIGGGLSNALLDHLFDRLTPGTRLVANAVTLESEALLGTVHQRHGGELMRIDLSRAAPLGSRRGWRSAYPLVQWSVTL